MTTIDIDIKMSHQHPHNGVRVRILQDPNQNNENEMISNYSPRMGRSSVKREKSTGELIKSPARKLKNPTHSFDLGDSFHHYDPEMFTITAYLPSEDMETEKQTRLKIPCYPGMTVQQVIETEIPNLINKSYLVYQFPSKALLNPEKEASVLQGQEIWIELARMHSPEEANDQRFAVVKELYRTEDAYLEHLRNIFDVYMEPLRNWGMPQSDMNTLFLSLSRLCDLLMNFFSELELAVKSWNTRTTLIGGIFKQYHSFWDMYIEYAQNYTIAMRLLKQKRMDESFTRFLDIKRGAAMHTLESLMLLPVQRLTDYHRYLSQLLSLTSRDHRDYQDIRLTVARTEQINQARADELVYLQNESKLEQVQLQFPSDNLFLTQTLDVIEASTPKRSKSVIQPPIPGGKTFNTGSSLKYSKTSMHCFPVNDTESIDSSGSRKNLRMYVQEGPVKLLVMNKQLVQERYLFLFSDLLLLAKPANKARTHQHRCYRLKNRLRLGEMWLSECTNEYVLSNHQCDSSFIIGWPLTNCIAMFSTVAEKLLWFNHISKNIQMQRKLCLSDAISIHISNSTTSTINVIPDFMQVNVSDQATDVIKNALEYFNITEPPDEFQLCVKLAKEDKEEFLHGFECPFAIQSHHNRHQIDLSGDMRPQQLEFVIRRKSSNPVSQSSRHTHTFFNFKKSRNKIKKGKDKIVKDEKMFGVPIEDLITNNQLPEKLQEILIRLWVDGPSTFGIFRISGNVRMIREIRESVDGRIQVDFSEVSIHVVGALLKELLRNVPGGILPSARYTEFVATNDIPDLETRIKKIRGVLLKLPKSNQIFLHYLLPLLHHISLHEEINSMGSTNLAICFAPSLLEPDYSLSVIKNEAPTLVDFMIKHATGIYNDELPELFRQLIPVSGDISESDREVERVEFIPLNDMEDMETSEDGLRKFYPGHQRNTSMDTCTSASEDSFDEEDNRRKCLPLVHTSSDSKVPEILSSTGKVMLLSDRSGEVSAGIEGDMSDMDEEEDEVSNKWVRQDITHSRANSFGNSNRIRHSSGDSTGRRKSISQITMSSHKRHYSPELLGTPPSPHIRGSSHSSGSQGYSPKIPHHLDPLESESLVLSGHKSEPSSNRQGHKKRRKPGHSNSFSKPSDLRYNEARIPQSPSASFYESYLIPSERSRSRTVAIPTPVSRAPHPEELTKSLDQSLIRTSNQSISSRTSGSSTGSQTQSRGTQTQINPTSVTSLISNRSGGSAGSRRSTSPDPLSQLSDIPMSNMSSDVIKHAISNRFGLTGDNRTTKPTSGNIKHDISTSTTHGDKEIDVNREGTGSLVEYPYQKSTPPYQEDYWSSSHQQMKRVESVETTISFDDRPEAERHLNSLPRVKPDEFKESNTSSSSLGRRGVYGHPEMVPLGVGYTPDNGSRLTIISGGYNSDTESSPSRTLNRLEKKLQEVTSPQTTRSSVPHRYARPNNTILDSPTKNDNSRDIFRPKSTENLQKIRILSSLDESKPETRSRSSTVSHGAYTSHMDPTTDDNSPGSSRNKRKSTYEVYKSQFETTPPLREKVSNVDVDTRKTLSTSLEVRSENPSKVILKQDRKTSPISTRHLGTPPDSSLKSRSMPDNTKRSVTRTLTTGSAVKTIKVIRYELPKPKKIRRINLRAYNSNK